jgi:radical SAM protein with 4Fe4S-binding SPASM domain
MSILSFRSPKSNHQVPRLDFELTQACDQRCAHCYNVWGEEETGYPRGQLPTDAYLAMMEKAIVESGATQVTLTGGEPLLRGDAMAIIARACELTSTVELVTNGAHVSPEAARELAALGVRAVQLTLLAARPELHDELKGAASFDDTTRAVCDLLENGVPVQACFVATRRNWRELAEVLELCLALGIRSLAYNRMSPAGGALLELLPTAEQVEANLDTAERLGRGWQIQVATAMPIPPCLIRIQRYRWIKFGFCSTGSRSPNLVIDPLGNVRSCNLSGEILGNIVERSWAQVMRNPYPERFTRALPPICRGCHYERSCQGGCKESALATFGALDHPEPFLESGRRR